MAFCGPRYTCVGRKKYFRQTNAIWIRNTAFFLANLRICGPRHQGNLQINHSKFVDWHTSEIYGFATALLKNQKFCGFAEKKKKFGATSNFQCLNKDNNNADPNPLITTSSRIIQQN
jgi:hypothetical protein